MFNTTALIAPKFGPTKAFWMQEYVAKHDGYHFLPNVEYLHVAEGGTVYAGQVLNYTAEAVDADDMQIKADYLGNGVLHDIWKADIETNVLGTLKATDMRWLNLEADLAFEINVGAEQSWFDFGTVFRAQINGDENEISASQVLRSLRSTGDETEIKVEGGRGSVSNVGDDTVTEVENFHGHVASTGDDTITEIEDSSGTVAVNGEHTETEIENFKGNVFVHGLRADVFLDEVTGRAFVTGEGSYVGVRDSYLEQFMLGENGYGYVDESFVKGWVSEDTNLSLYESQSILTLAGGSTIYQSGGQSIIYGKNGVVDEFVFYDRALVDGNFDSFDVVRTASGAEWEMGHLLAGNGFIELPGDQVVIAGSADSSADNLVFG